MDDLIKIATPILTVIVGLLIFIWNKQSKEVDMLKTKVSSIETNYNTKFDKVYNKIDINTEQHYDIRESNLKEHTELKVLIAKILTKMGIE